MREPVQVMVLGTGQMGSGIARLLLNRPGVELAGAYARRSERGGQDIGPATGMDHETGIIISNDLQHTLSQCKPDVAIQATCSHVADAVEEISTLLHAGVNVISIAEEMAFPAAASPELAERIRREAIENQVAIVGTGVNPGFVMDLLVVTLSGVCAEIEAITVKRINDLSAYGPSVLISQGIGLDPESFAAGVRDNTIAGHIGFRQSIHMIAASLGWDIERIEEKKTAIVSGTRRETGVVTIEPGQVAGCNHTAVGYCSGKPVIELTHPQQISPEVEGTHTGDYIHIRGTPEINIAGSPEIPGGQATCALAVNMIPRILSAAPGLYNMAELPVPTAITGDLRTRIKTRPSSFDRIFARD